MKNFLAVFKCAENSENHAAWKKLSKEEQEERREKGEKSLSLWTERYRDRIIYDGGPLDDKTKIVDNRGIRDIPSNMGAFAVVKANSHLEAANIFLDHPHFTYFPGDGVEVVELKNRLESHKSD